VGSVILLVLLAPQMQTQIVSLALQIILYLTMVFVLLHAQLATLIAMETALNVLLLVSIAQVFQQHVQPV
jgi:hypothetical protein